MSLLPAQSRYLEHLMPRIDWANIDTLRHARYVKNVLSSPEVRSLEQMILQLKLPKSDHLNFGSDVVEFGAKGEISMEQRAILEETLWKLAPWKKGPLNFFGTEIDAEWRSDWKWNRIEPHLHSLQDRIIADFGCSNGYFMWRMMHHNPKHVVGFDPYAKTWLKFELMNKIAGRPNMDFELLGAEHAYMYPECFDTVFCLGVIYHHTDPMGMLRSLHASLRKGGQLIIESMGIPGEEPHCLVPRGRYAKARGIWNLPSESCLANWLQRVPFQKVECFYNEPLSVEEQRRSKWADIDSLREFLTEDQKKTVEGYPAPHRIYFKAVK